MKFIELTQIIHGHEFKCLVNTSRIASVSQDGDSGNCVVEFDIDEYYVVSESYNEIKEMLEGESNE